MAGLYAGLANGGKFAPPAVRRDRPRPQPVQLIGPTATWYVGDVLAGAPLPDGFASLPVALRDRRIAFKTGTSAGFRDAWAAGYSANWTVVVWVGHADGASRPGQLGRHAALPILFKAFSRLETSRNVKTGGVGLGLTIARDIVLAHGGSIAAESPVSGGRGTCMTMMFSRRTSPRNSP